MRRILIVDDEPSILSGLSKALCKVCNFEGEVKTVDNGNDAVEEIGHCYYDICFLDITLPDVNGLEIMKEINRISPETSVVIMTANFVNEDMKSVIEEGASLFVTKPFNLSQIKVFMKYVLERSKEEFIEEKRQFQRRPFVKTTDYFVWFTESGEMKFDLRTDFFDISSGGMGIWTDYPLKHGQVLIFREGAEQKSGVVKWSTLIDDNYRSGVQFIS